MVNRAMVIEYVNQSTPPKSKDTCWCHRHTDAVKHTKNRTYDALGRAPACQTPTSWEGAVYNATRWSYHRPSLGGVAQHMHGG